MFDVIDKLEELIKYIRETRGINDRDRIIDIIEGNGKLSNKAGKIVFEGFSAGIKGTYSYLEEIWLNKDKYIGQLATVEYQNKTSNNIPRFPKVKAIRNYE